MTHITLELPTRRLGERKRVTLSQYLREKPSADIPEILGRLIEKLLEREVLLPDEFQDIVQDFSVTVRRE